MGRTLASSDHNDTRGVIVMATLSYKGRIKAASAEASAQRKAEQAARQRQIELRCEVHRLAMAAVKAGIQAKGQRKLSTYSRAELTMMANALIAPWFIEQVRAKIAERTGHSLSQTVISSAKQGEVSQ
jgi:enoyl-CoA hydratase/carnithine racemase